MTGAARRVLGERSREGKYGLAGAFLNVGSEIDGRETEVHPQFSPG